ncbi:MAG: hypothetical protein RL754_214 [Bacteroidota bacterium]|jgi:hypothetical protein
MIQRIQTLYLLAASFVSALAAFNFPMYSVGETSFDSQSTGLAFAGFGFAMAAFSGAILFFNNRKVQLFLVRLGMFDNLLVLGALIMAIQGIEGAQASWGVVAPFLNIVLAFFASKGIRADEKVVKSYDRLR